MINGIKIILRKKCKSIFFLIKRKNLSERKINVKKQATLDKFKIKTSITDKELPSLESNKTISIFSWNVNGIRAISKKDNFKDFFEKGMISLIILRGS